MFDVKNLNDGALSLLSSMHLSAEILNGSTDPATLSVRKLQRARAKIMNSYNIDFIEDFPRDIAEELAKLDDAEFFTLLKDAVEEEKTREQQRKDAFENLCENSDSKTALALRAICLAGEYGGVKVEDISEDGTVNFRFATSAMSVRVTLTGAEGVPNTETLTSLLHLGQKPEYNAETKKYTISGNVYNEEKALDEKAEFIFSGAKADYEKIKHMGAYVVTDDSPWEILGQACGAIEELRQMDLCSDAELELLPLIKEIEFIGGIFEEGDPEFASFPQIKVYAEKSGCKKLVKLLNELEKISSESPKYRKKMGDVLYLLNSAGCEMLWRKIYDRIYDSQKDYPSAPSYIDPELLESRRQTVTKGLHACGYTGQYPDFEKVGGMRGVHLERSRGQCFLVGMKRRVKYIIHCTEFFGEDGEINIRFVCGTAFLKKKENEKDIDIYSCMFFDNGRRLMKSVDCVSYDENYESETGNIPAFAKIAAKRAECLRLTKAEKKMQPGVALPGIGLFSALFIFAGGLFAAFMILCIMILCTVVTCIVGGLGGVPDMFAEMPWLTLFILSWLLFGFGIGITEVISQRK